MNDSLTLIFILCAFIFVPEPSMLSRRLSLFRCASIRHAASKTTLIDAFDFADYPPQKANTIFNICPGGHTMIVERFGKFHKIHEPGWFIALPFIDHIRYVHDMRELTVPIARATCTTKDNVRVDVGGTVYFKFDDAYKASYGASRPMLAIIEHAKSVMRSAVGRLDLDEAFHDREKINSMVIHSLHDASPAWGVRVLRYEVTDILPDENIRHAMDLQAAAEREKRQKVKNAEADKQATVLAAEAQRQRDTNESEGARTRLINEAEGHARSVVLRAEAEKSRIINEAEGRAEAARLIAKADADALRMVAAALETPSGQQALQAELASKYLQSLRALGQKSNTIFMNQNLGDVSSMVAHATSIVKTLGSADSGVKL